MPEEKQKKGKKNGAREKSFVEEFERKQRKNNTQKDEQQRWLACARLFLPPTTCESESFADEYTMPCKSTILSTPLWYSPTS